MRVTEKELTEEQKEKVSQACEKILDNLKKDLGEFMFNLIFSIRKES